MVSSNPALFFTWLCPETIVIYEVVIDITGINVKKYQNWIRNSPVLWLPMSIRYANVEAEPNNSKAAAGPRSAFFRFRACAASRCMCAGDFPERVNRPVSPPAAPSKRSCSSWPRTDGTWSCRPQVRGWHLRGKLHKREARWARWSSFFYPFWFSFQVIG